MHELCDEAKVADPRDLPRRLSEVDAQTNSCLSAILCHEGPEAWPVNVLLEEIGRPSESLARVLVLRPEWYAMAYAPPYGKVVFAYRRRVNPDKKGPRFINERHAPGYLDEADASGDPDRLAELDADRAQRWADEDSQ